MGQRVTAVGEKTVEQKFSSVLFIAIAYKLWAKSVDGVVMGNLQ